MKFNVNDTVKINHPEIEGTGIITKFHNDKFHGVEVEIIKASRKSDGKQAKPGRKFNCLRKHLTVIKKAKRPSLIITDDTLMTELFKSEEETIGVVTPEFVGRWK